MGVGRTARPNWEEQMAAEPIAELRRTEQSLRESEHRYRAFVDHCPGIVDQGRMVQQMPVGDLEVAGQRVNLRILDVRPGDPPLIRVVVSSNRQLNEHHVDGLKQLIGARIGSDLLLEAQLNLRR